MSKKPPSEAYIKASKKPAPKTTQAWMAEVGGVTKFTDNLKEIVDANGPEWLKSMRDYYLARLDFLLAEKPPGLSSKTSKAIVEEVRKKLA